MSTLIRAGPNYYVRSFLFASCLYTVKQDQYLPMNIAFFDVQDHERELLATELAGFEVQTFDEPLSKKAIPSLLDVEVISGFVYSSFTKDILRELPKLKLIITRSTGFDHIDLKACKRLGIRVAHVPTYGSRSVAEHAFALLLTLSRQTHRAYMRTSRGDYGINDLMGFDLYEKTMGIVGTGNIGRHVARIAHGFGMKVLAYDVSKDKELESLLGFKYVSLKELYKQSDVISLHVPAVKETTHMLNKSAFKQMKEGVTIINTSRGSIIDSKALVEALETGKVRAAGLDVLEGEHMFREDYERLAGGSITEKDMDQLSCNCVLLHKKNVLFTSHMAFYSEEALERMICTVIETVKSFKEDYVLNEVNF